MKTLPVGVYRNAWIGDCTNDGISASQERLYLVCDQGFHDLPDGDPRLIRLVKRSFHGGESAHLSVEPVNDPRYGDGKHVGPMFGGNFVYTSDSRFPSDYPIPIHDRFETQEQYDQLSR